MTEIRKHFIHVGGERVAYKATPNIGAALVPEGIILHDTAGGLKADGSIAWLCNPKAKASAHVVVGRDGVITQLAPLDVRTWHAGVSKWKGRTNVNAFTIGIEIVNPGKMTKAGADYSNGPVRIAGTMDVLEAATKAHGKGLWLQYTDQQIRSVTELCRAIVETYGVAFIGTHWEIAPGRKVDTNPLFPLEAVRRAALEARPVMLLGGAGNDEVEDLRGEDDGFRSNVSAPSGFRDEPETDAVAPHGQEDENIRAIQTRLNAMGYSPGGIDGRWGDMTAAAIAGFKNSRRLLGPAVIDDALKVELTKAEGEGFKRPIAPERATANEAKVAEIEPAMTPVVRGRFWGMLGLIGTSIMAVFNAAADYFKDALAWVSGFRGYFNDIPGWTWLVLAAGVAGFFAWNSMQGARGIKSAVQKGERL